EHPTQVPDIASESFHFLQNGCKLFGVYFSSQRLRQCNGSFSQRLSCPQAEQCLDGSHNYTAALQELKRSTCVLLRNDHMYGGGDSTKRPKCLNFFEKNLSALL